MIMNGRLQAGRFLFQKRDMLLKRLVDRVGLGHDLGFFLTILFAEQVSRNGVQAVEQSLQGFNFGGRLHQATIAGQHLAIAGIGFRAHRQPLAERLGLGRIHDGHGRASVEKPPGGGWMIDAGRLENQMNLAQVRDFLAGQPLAPFDEALWGIGHRFGVTWVAIRDESTDLQFFLGDIDTEGIQEVFPGFRTPVPPLAGACWSGYHRQPARTPNPHRCAPRRSRKWSTTTATSGRSFRS